MGWNDDKAFGGFWDLGEFIEPDLISYPIKKMIERDARKADIDIDNPIHSIASIIGAGFMGAMLGPFLGPFMAIWEDF